MKKDALDQVCGAFLQLKTPREVRLFLEDLLTAQELESVTERLQIFRLLLKGTTQRRIQTLLNVSISKVIRGAHAWHDSKGGARVALERIGADLW